MIEKVKISRARVYFSMMNAFTLTKYSGYYPEVGRGARGRGAGYDIYNAGVDERAYPSARTTQLGIQLSF